MWMMETERLCVRPFAAEDLEALHSILSDEEVMRWLEAPYSRKQTETFLAHVRGAEPPPVFAVTWKETGRVIGQLIFHPFDRESWELGWILRRDVWRQGLADELTRAILRDAEALGIPALVIEGDPRQQITRHIAEKHGFAYEGEVEGLALYRRRIQR